MSSEGDDPYPVTDEERNAVLVALVSATTEGQLTLEEFGRRTDLVLTTGSRLDLEAVTGGLEIPVEGRVKRHWWVPFGDRVVRGRFALARKTNAVMLMSEIHLDLRGATLLGPEPVIKLRVLVGSLRVLVPPGIQVEVDQTSLFGGRSITTFGPPPSAARPLLRIRMIDVLGSVKVTDDPETWSPYLTARAPGA
jgi:Domain of unknown function (DUF1707)/Cell wall-active antibiotics response 4TMS YvqF